MDLGMVLLSRVELEKIDSRKGISKAVDKLWIDCLLLSGNLKENNICKCLVIKFKKVF